jgi:diaminopimelate epimerase
MRLPLIHCHGSGNDFPLIDARGLGVDPAAWPAIARALADRAGPVGGDGLLLLGDGREDGGGRSDFAMKMFNSDGSEAETCLNGLRCVARLAFERLGIDAGRAGLKQSAATVARAADLAPGVYAVRETAGPVSLDLADWPLHAGIDRLIDAALPPLGSARAFTAVAMPNPHLVAFVDGVDEAELVAIGTACEAAPAWLPRRANVSFVEVRGPDALFVRTFERGVGLTDSCGSAMGASAYAACLTGRMAWDADLTVFNKGGLVGATAHPDGRVTLVGNATWEWAGSIDWDPAAGLSDLAIERRFDGEIAAWAALANAER